MKKLLLISALTMLLVTSGQAQDKTHWKSVTNYTQFDFGIYNYEITKYFDIPPYLPGIAYYWGKSRIGEKNFILEYSAGLALPGIFTAKLGFGYNFKFTQVVLGARILPMNFYLQAKLGNTKKGCWVATAEYSPFKFSQDFIFNQRASITVGYRKYILGSKKDRRENREKYFKRNKYSTDKESLKNVPY